MITEVRSKTGLVDVDPRHEGEYASAVLRWIAEGGYSPRTSVMAFEPRSRVIQNQLAEVERRSRAFNLDDGYQFPETLRSPCNLPCAQGYLSIGYWTGTRVLAPGETVERTGRGQGRAKAECCPHSPRQRPTMLS